MKACVCGRESSDGNGRSLLTRRALWMLIFLRDLRLETAVGRRIRRRDASTRVRAERDLRMEPNGDLRFRAGAPHRRGADDRSSDRRCRFRQRGGWQRCRPPFRLCPACEITRLRRSRNRLIALRCDAKRHVPIRLSACRQLIPVFPVIHRRNGRFCAWCDSVFVTAL